VASLLLAGVASMAPIAATLIAGQQVSALSALSVLGILAGLLVLYFQVSAFPNAA
jgi:hypothetical protein